MAQIAWSEYKAALAILEQEQRAYLPSPRQIILFRSFNYLVHASVIFGAILVYSILKGTEADLEKLVWLAWLEFTLVVLIIPLFVLNWGFILKLRRLGRLRRILGLETALKKAFKAGHEKSLLSHVNTIFIATLGVLVVAFSLFGLVSIIYLSVTEAQSSTPKLNEIFLLLAVALAIGMVGASFISLHFMWRGKRRLSVLRDLQAVLAEYEDQFDENSQGSISFDAGTYNQIARMERAQIIGDRNLSLESAAKKTSDHGYSLYRSNQSWESSSQLSGPVRVLVEEFILQLSQDPFFGDKIKIPETEYLLAAVPGTDVSLIYEVDESSHRIQVLSLKGSGLDESIDLAGGGLKNVDH